MLEQTDSKLSTQPSDEDRRAQHARRPVSGHLDVLGGCATRSAQPPSSENDRRPRAMGCVLLPTLEQVGDLGGRADVTEGAVDDGEG